MVRVWCFLSFHGLFLIITLFCFMYAGVAFAGLRGRTLYPMASSTAARSGMKVISSRSFPSSLQFLCCQKLRKFIPSHLSVLDTLSMPPGLRAFLANNMSWLLHVPHASLPKPSPDFTCHICLPLKNVLEGCTSDEDSSGEERTDLRREIISIRGSDTESSDEELEDFSDTNLHRHSLASYLVGAHVRRWSGPGSTSSSSNFPANSDAASSLNTSNSSRSQTVPSRAKKPRLDSSETPDSDDQNSQHSEDEEKDQDSLSQTQVVDLMEEGVDPERQHRLGKRKRT